MKVTQDVVLGVIGAGNPMTMKDGRSVTVYLGTGLGMPLETLFRIVPPQSLGKAFWHVFQINFANAVSLP